MIEYRDGTAADLPAIEALFRKSFTATFGHLYAPQDLAAFFAKSTPEAWAEEFAEPEIAFHLAFSGERLVGFVKLGALELPAETSAPATELRQLYLDEDAKGTGAAAVLMDWAIATARARGSRELWLSVYIDNHRAKRFYQRYGFEDRGLYRFMVGNHADEDRLMRLAL